jgi:hypothetical protein
MAGFDPAIQATRAALFWMGGSSPPMEEGWKVMRETPAFGGRGSLV